MSLHHILYFGHGGGGLGLVWCLLFLVALVLAARRG
jgi:hypothetical protein